MLIKLFNRITGKTKSIALDKLLSKRSKGIRTGQRKLDKPHGSNYGKKFSIAGNKVSSAYTYVRQMWDGPSDYKESRVVPVSTQR